jgi:hypothetical protein
LAPRLLRLRRASRSFQRTPSFWDRSASGWSSTAFGLENFDAVGAWRDRDGQFEIDASGELPGGLAFSGSQELMTILKESRKSDFTRCVAEKMLTYALGRGLDSYDRCAVDAIVKQLAEGDYRFSSLVTAIVLSDPFLLRQSTGEE